MEAVIKNMFLSAFLQTGDRSLFREISAPIEWTIPIVFHCRIIYESTRMWVLELPRELLGHAACRVQNVEGKS